MIAIQLQTKSGELVGSVLIPRAMNPMPETMIWNKRAFRFNVGLVYVETSAWYVTELAEGETDGFIPNTGKPCEPRTGGASRKTDGSDQAAGELL